MNVLSYLHIKTITLSLSQTSLLKGTSVLQEVFSLMNSKQKKEWETIVSDTYLSIEESFSLSPSQKNNGIYVLKKLGFDPKSYNLLAWDYLELDRIYNRHISKLKNAFISAADKKKFQEKVKTKLDKTFENTHETQLNLVLKKEIDRIAQRLNINMGVEQNDERFMKSKRIVTSLEINECCIAIESLEEMINTHHSPSRELILWMMDTAKTLFLHVKANVDSVRFNGSNLYWAVCFIKHLSLIKMYYIDEQTQKKSYYAEGYRQEKLNVILSRLYPKAEAVEIQKLSIDEKLEHLWGAISECLELGEFEKMPPDVLKEANANKKFIALILLNNLLKSVERCQVSWGEEYRALYKQLFKKYMTHTLSRAKDIQKPILSKPNANYFHKYTEGCMECIEIP